jgi:hypothetical protein
MKIQIKHYKLSIHKNLSRVANVLIRSWIENGDAGEQ